MFEPIELSAVSPERAALYRSNGWWPDQSLAARFRSLADQDPARLILSDEDGAELTRHQLWTQAEELALRLRESGVRPGDVVLIYLPNTAIWQISLLSVLQVGAVPATLPLSSDEETLTYVHELIGARAVVAPTTYRGRPIGEWARRAAEASGYNNVVVLADAGAVTMDHVGSADRDAVVPAGVDHLMFTSSTTGKPKAVMHTANTLAAVNIAFSARFHLDENAPIFMPSPLGHSVGAWHGGRLSLYSGAPLVLQAEWDPVRALQIVEEKQCAFTAASTPYLKDLVDAEWQSDSTKLASLRVFLCGGAPVPPSLLEAAHEQAPNTFVTVLWGMTEGTGTTCVPDSTAEQLTESAGKAVDNLELAIIDADDTGQGELVMRGAGVFVGYLGQEDLYRESMTGDGWFRTADLARIDSSGYLNLTGRLKDMIIRGGVNISPVPIENAIARHPAVRRVAVIGRPDDRLGERICAVIVPADTTAPTLGELIDWLRAQGLSERLLPEWLEVVEEMPVTAAGKIRKVDLRDSLGVRS